MIEDVQLIDRIKSSMQFEKIVKFNEVNAFNICHPEEKRYMLVKTDLDDVVHGLVSMIDAYIVDDIIKHKFVRNLVYEGVDSLDAAIGLLHTPSTSVLYYPLKWFAKIWRPVIENGKIHKELNTTAGGSSIDGVTVCGSQILNDTNIVLICDTQPAYTFDVAFYESDEFIGMRTVRREVNPIGVVYGVRV